MHVGRRRLRLRPEGASRAPFFVGALFGVPIFFMSLLISSLALDDPAREGADGSRDRGEDLARRADRAGDLRRARGCSRSGSAASAPSCRSWRRSSRACSRPAARTCYIARHEARVPGRHGLRQGQHDREREQPGRLGARGEGRGREHVALDARAGAASRWAWRCSSCGGGRSRWCSSRPGSTRSSARRRRLPVEPQAPPQL